MNEVLLSGGWNILAMKNYKGRKDGMMDRAK